MPKRKTKPPEQKPQTSSAQNPLPKTQSVEALRVALAEKAEAFVAQLRLRDCPRPACRRRKACAREGACESRRPRREASPDEWERMKVTLLRELKRRRAELDREEAV